MDLTDDTTTFLLETIRKELVSIIDEGSPKNVFTEGHAKVQHECDRDGAANGSAPINHNKGNPTLSSESKPSPGHSEFIESHCYHAIDEDLQKMHLNLTESYELFQTISDRFENINFGCLKTRIKDLHINDKNNVPIKTIVDDLKNTFDQKYMENRLNDLTQEVASKFRKHPGEFCDIPELSEFFRAFTQLQHALDRLTRQRDDVQTLKKRMTHAVEMSFERFGEI